MRSFIRRAIVAFMVIAVSAAMMSLTSACDVASPNISGKVVGWTNLAAGKSTVSDSVKEKPYELLIETKSGEIKSTRGSVEMYDACWTEDEKKRVFPECYQYWKRPPSPDGGR